MRNEASLQNQTKHNQDMCEGEFVRVRREVRCVAMSNGGELKPKG